MRHNKEKYTLNRYTSWRKATISSLVRSVLKYQSIKTTKVKAMAAKPVLEKLISLTKKDDGLNARRRAFDVLQDHRLVKFLFSDIGLRFKNKDSGFSRVLNLGNRRGDNAPMAILELTQIIKKEPKKPKKIKSSKPQIAETPSIRPSGEEGVKPDVPVAKAKIETETVVKEKPPIIKKPAKKFLGGLKNIFKKERDSL